MTTEDGGTIEPLLQMRGVTVRFGGLLALTEVDLEVHPGSVTGLIGPNGAGKTTLFNVLSGLVTPTSGAVTLEGRDLLALPAEKRPGAGLGRTFQVPKLLLDLSAEANAAAGAFVGSRPSIPRGLVGFVSRGGVVGAARQEAARLLARFDPSVPLGTPVGKLPLAQRRTVEIIRALCSRPRLVLLDEPFGGLHVHERERMRELVLSVRNHGIAVLLIEHDMEMVTRLCDAVYVLNFGTLLAHGPPAEVARRPDVVEAYLGTAHA